MAFCQVEEDAEGEIKDVGIREPVAEHHAQLIDPNESGSGITVAANYDSKTGKMLLQFLLEETTRQVGRSPMGSTARQGPLTSHQHDTNRVFNRVSMPLIIMQTLRSPARDRDSCPHKEAFLRPQREVLRANLRQCRAFCLANTETSWVTAVEGRYDKPLVRAFDVQ